MNTYGPALPELIGGSADLTGSNLTLRQDSTVITDAVAAGNYLYYGVREFAMAAINNGLALHGGFVPYGGTFLIFTEYARNALRMAALMKQRTIFVLTHDSIGLGEDGPTHQAVEQAATLRLIPNMSVWRPCDAVETAVAWKSALENRDNPTALLLSRQSLPCMERTAEQLDAIARGAYILVEPEGGPELIIIATGSEVAIAADAARQLNARRQTRARRLHAGNGRVRQATWAIPRTGPACLRAAGASPLKPAYPITGANTSGLMVTSWASRASASQPPAVPCSSISAST